MNAPSTAQASEAPKVDRVQRRAQVVAELGAVLPRHALLWHTEDTIPYGSACRWSRAVRVRGSRAARCRTSSV